MVHWDRTVKGFDTTTRQCVIPSFSVQTQKKYCDFVRLSFCRFTILLIIFTLVEYLESLEVYLLDNDRFYFRLRAFIENSFLIVRFALERERHLREKRKICLAAQSAKEMEEIMQRGMPAQALALRADETMQRKQHFTSLKDEVPAGSLLYEQHSRFLSFLRRSGKTHMVALDQLPGSKIVESKHLDVGNLSPGENEIINVKLVDDSQLPRGKMASAYSIVNTRRRESGSATALHVGAIEVIFDSFASPDSDLVGGVMLVDTNHTRVENAVRSVFVTSFAGGVPIRVLLFPNTLVEINEAMNNRFKLICTTSNGDFKKGANLAAVKVNVVGCTKSLTHTYTPSPFLEEELNRERGTIVEYLGKTGYVMHNVNNITAEEMEREALDFQVTKSLNLQHYDRELGKVQRSSSMRFLARDGKPDFLKSYRTGTSTQGRHSVDVHQPEPDTRAVPVREHITSDIDPVEGEIQRAYGQGDGEPNISPNLVELFDTRPVMRGSPLRMRLATTKVVLPKILTGGTILKEGLLSELLTNTQQAATVGFMRTHVQDRQLVAMATVGVPENTGLCLMMCFNSAIRGKATVDAYTASSQASHMWNPACKANAVLEFSPNPCKSSWSYQYLRMSRCHFSVVCISGWTTTPMTDISMTIDWYLSDKLCYPEIYCAGGGMSRLPLNRWMGKLTFEQGVNVVIKRMPLSIGGGAGVSGKIFENMPNALCTLWRYIHGGLKFDVIKMSSPFIKSTISFFIAFTDVDATTVDLEAYPHKLVQFGEVQDRVELDFGPEDFAMAWSAQVRNTTPTDQIGCPCLYAVTHDSTGSTLAGDFNIGVQLKEMYSFSGYGRAPGWIGAFAIGASLQGPRVTSDRVFNKLYEIRGPPEAKANEIAQVSFDLIGVGIATDGKGAWSLDTFNSPMNNLLRTATWKTGKLVFQVLMEGNFTVKRGDWASYTQIQLRQSRQDRALNAREWTMKDPHSWELEFEIDLCGPNDGFESWESQWSNQTGWFLDMNIYNPDQTTVFSINGYVTDTFCCAGNTLMPGFLEPSNVQRMRTVPNYLQDYEYDANKGKKSKSGSSASKKAFPMITG
uniref:RNA2 polyprotein n=1 Tax=White-flower bittercress comovirus TaxID=3115808 RepID=A0AAT9JBE7_9SECO